MTDLQMYLAISIPSILALLNLAVILALFRSLSSRIERVETRVVLLIGAVNELGKRLRRIEIKLGIQQ